MKRELNTKIKLKNFDELYALNAAIRFVSSPVNGSPLWSHNIQEALLKFQRKLTLLQEKENGTYCFIFNKEQKENLSFALNECKYSINTYMSSQCSEIYNKLFK